MYSNVHNTYWDGKNELVDIISQDVLKRNHTTYAFYSVSRDRIAHLWYVNINWN